MADFKTHSVLGTAAAILYAFLCCVAGILSPIRAVLAAVLFSLSSVLPDLDSDTGTAKRFLFESLAILVPALIILYKRPDTVEQALLLLLLFYFLIRYLLGDLFSRFTMHRGIFHSIPMAFLFGLAACLLFFASPPAVRYIYALAVTAGYMVHLILDEIWSFGLFGLGAKRSFGTALKLRSNSRIVTAITYILLILLGLAVWDMQYYGWLSHIFDRISTGIPY